MFHKRGISDNYTYETSVMVEKLRLTGQLILIHPGTSIGQIRTRLNNNNREVVVINASVLESKEEVASKIGEYKKTRYTLIFDEADKAADQVRDLILKAALINRNIMLTELEDRHTQR